MSPVSSVRSRKPLLLKEEAKYMRNSAVKPMPAFTTPIPSGFKNKKSPNWDNSLDRPNSTGSAHKVPKRMITKPSLKK